jgi:predicted ATP-dependent endonuclease of OLD family
MYRYDQKPGTRVSDSSREVLTQVRDSEYSVLVGRNNCGKSYLLKTLTQEWGEKASYLGPARYQNFNLLGYFTPNKNRKREKWQQFLQQWQRESQNFDNSPVNLQQAIAELSDDERSKLSEIIEILLGVKLDIRQTLEGNSMSQKYISCGGHNISFTSSGFRLITTLVTSLLDPDYDTFLIDEPELGISPEAQGILADFLFDREHRQRFFPHVRTLVFATHSTIFLDRRHLGNNYAVTKEGDEISVSRVRSQSDFNRIHFFLLGNRFETLYLPSAILLVEGRCDHAFIERLLSLRFPDSQISVVPAHSDSRIKEVLSVTKGLFEDLQKSPYRDRIFVVLDSTHSAGLPEQLTRMGVPKENIVIWPKNGIEFCYPPSLMDRIFGVGSDIVVNGDLISRNGISYSKGELLSKVLQQMEPGIPMHADFEELLLTPLREKLGIITPAPASGLRAVT